MEFGALMNVFEGDQVLFTILDDAEARFVLYLDALFGQLYVDQIKRELDVSVFGLVGLSFVDVKPKLSIWYES